MDDNLINYGKREERERILGMIEFSIRVMGDSSYEKYAKKKMEQLIKLIENNV